MFARPGLCGMGIGRLGLVAASRSLFDPLSLFVAGEVGAWYDPSDLSTLFQDAAGTTPVTAAGQLVGRMLDKSGRGNHATQSTSGDRPTLQQDANGRYYLLASGTTTWMSTSAINMTGTNKVSVFAGLRKLSDAARGMFAEMGVGAVGGIRIEAPLSTMAGSLAFASSGTTGAFTNQTGFTAPFSAVLACAGDIGSDVCSMKVNGAAAVNASTDQGTGNYGNLALYLFRRGGTTLPFNGHFYGLILRGAASTSDQVANAERWMAAKTGVTL